MAEEEADRIEGSVIRRSFSSPGSRSDEGVIGFKKRAKPQRMEHLIKKAL